MRVYLFIALAVAMLVICEARTLSETDYQKAFTNFVKKYHKQYPHDEFFNRYQVFKANYDYIRAHNQGKHTYSLAVNEFADLTFAEFHDRYTGFNNRDSGYLRAKNPMSHKDLLHATPVTVDWRTQNAVTPIKNQAQCGSCWAFSTTGSVEGSVAIGSGKLISLSEQQLVDCSSSYGNQGCNGGLMDDAFQYIIASTGLCTEAAYPYTAVTGTTCLAANCTAAATITGFVDVAAGDENALLVASAITPVSVAIEADQQAFQFYSGGVFNAACGTQLDHGVLTVGYGHDATSALDYWIVKNSWGTTWGEQGYMRMVRGQNECGISNVASYPTGGKAL